MESLYVQGRKLEAKDLEWIRELIEAHRDWNRTKLSEYIAQNWGWRNEVGRLKDMACRTMLLKLEQKGLLCLPARQRPSNNRCSWRPGPLPISQYPLPSPIESRLSTLEPLSIVPAQSPQEVALFDWLLWRYHYLPYSGAVGENIRYLAFDCQARPLAWLLYGAAAWKLSIRDRFIGWSKEQRQANLSYVANNLRFLTQLPHFQNFFGAFLGVIAREAAILLDRYPKNANYSHELCALCSCRNWMYKLYRHACSSSGPPNDSRARPTSIISWWSRWLRIKDPVIG